MMKYLLYSIACLAFSKVSAQNTLENFNLKGKVLSFTEVVFKAEYNSNVNKYIKQDTIQVVTNYFNNKGLLTYAMHKSYKDGSVNFSMYLTYGYKNDSLAKIMNREKPRDFKGENPIESIGSVSYPIPNKQQIDVVSEKENLFHYQNTMTFENKKLKTFVMRDLLFGREPLLSEFYEYDKNGDILKTVETSLNNVTTTKHLKYDKYKNSIYSVSKSINKSNEFEIRERIIKYKN